MFPAAMVLPMFNGQPLVSPRLAASASAEIPRVWQCPAHDLHHHFVRLRFSRRMPLFNWLISAVGLIGRCQPSVGVGGGTSRPRVIPLKNWDRPKRPRARRSSAWCFPTNFALLSSAD